MTGGGKCVVCKLVGLLVIIGALNWGLIALNGTDLVAQLLGAGSTGARVVYGLVGIAGVLSIVSCFGLCPCQKSGACSKP